MKYPIKKLIKEPHLIKKIFPHNPLAFQSINPSNNHFIKGYNFDTPSEIQTILERAHNAAQILKQQTLDQQLEKMTKLEQIVKKNSESIAQMMSLEMGKSITEARLEVERVTIQIKYYLDHSKIFLADKPLADFGNYRNYITHEPLGPILNVSPWNFPLAVPLKSIIPSLIARNPVILKPAPNVPETSIMLKDCFYQAGFNHYEFQLSFSDVHTIDNIISDKRVAYVVFTGSTQAGKTIGALAGKNIKRCLLELGGSDPMLILKDADMDHAVNMAITGRLRANGQACNSTKRVIVHHELYEEFKRLFTERLNKVKVGDALKNDTQVGPLARFDLFMKLNDQLENHIEDYEYSIDKGNFFKPMIITDLVPSDRAYKEELFGPVFQLYKAYDNEEMIKLANDTEYGLSACVITKNIAEGENIVKHLEAGMTFVNTNTVTSPGLPFGGYKNSGFGRNNSFCSFNEFTNMKTVTVLKH